MNGSTLKTSKPVTVLLFGGHVLSQTKQSLAPLLKALAEGPNSKWIKDTVTGLPAYWDALVNEIPDIGSAVSGAELLADLDSWLQHGLGHEASFSDESLPNLVVGPLLVAIQLDQYWRYLENFSPLREASRGDDLQAALVASQSQADGFKVEILGFCVGLLGALSVASSRNRQDYENFGAAAMRISMFIGALLDAREVWDKNIGKGKSVSYATAWRGPKQFEQMNSIISSLFPEAYTSVLFDKARATVTTSERTAPSLVRQLRAAGLTVAEIGIDGHIHSPGPERARHTDIIAELCRKKQGLKFADASELALLTYDNQGGGLPITPDRGDMTEMVLNSILVSQCQWYDTISKVMEYKHDACIVAFGLDRCIPPTMIRHLGSRQQHYEDIAKANVIIDHTASKPKSRQQHEPQLQETGATSMDFDPNAIAVVGMSIKVAGADDLDEFVEMLKRGDSQHELISRDRLQHEILHREDAGANPNQKFYANFIRDSDAFDHKFFKKSPRESQAIDPQSRLCLEGAYQAVEQSGYFTETTSSDANRDKLHVGVYLGNCGVDYEHNIACNPPTPFTATGGLKSFIVGRLSHYFGWTGPSVTIDTACSSSTVAIHTACRNLLSGECTAALCGGVNVITNMLWMQNLAAGSFISHTGQCKPFDDAADGYCRAEGMAFVFLKKLSDAVADGNPILATIPSTIVYQNLNITPLFVPNAPSLSHLFKNVIRDAGLDPSEISLVEAHGTGTPVGDPAEYESIRLALGGPIRDKPLPFGSVKGHIGHTEGASGIIALIKVVMMMRHCFIPAQASFNKLNHQIEVRSDDMMEVVRSLRPWTESRKIALINNYGACGSNASMIVTQPPRGLSRTPAAMAQLREPARFPFWITGLDVRSIAAYSAKLASWLQSHTEDDGTRALADLSFSMGRQSNRNLPQGLIFSCKSLSELKGYLLQAATATKANAASMGISPTHASRPVILCFGGQVSKFVGLDRDLHDSVTLLRWHLEACDAVIKSAGLGSIYPDIFSRELVQDTVKLQLMLFALQYSCARTWMDCGLDGKISAVVGHSFGEITALCVAGALSLEDTVKLVAGRARLVRDIWGSDSGAMIAVEASQSLVEELLSEANSRSDGSAAIACYNGQSSFTLAGSTEAMNTTAELMTRSSKFAGIKNKRLNVTNAFHSTLVDKLVDGLGDVGKGLTFRQPTIPVEHASKIKSDSALDWTFVPSHMRNPVFFDHAVRRLSEQYPQAVFLEAGSSSTITVMAARALAKTATTTGTHHFQAMGITDDNKNKSSIDALTDATIALWKQGLSVSFWAHHPKQAQEYGQMLLPPYQFDKSGRHWLHVKSPSEEINKAAEAIVAARGLTLGVVDAKDKSQKQQDPRLMDMFTFAGYQDEKAARPRFLINTASDKYQHFFSGHIIAQTAPICPATLESDMAIEALFSLYPELKAERLSPVLRNLVNHSPICSNTSRAVYIDFDAIKNTKSQWDFKLCSASADAANKDVQLHVEGRLHFRSPSDAEFVQEFERYERLVTHARCQALLKLSMDDDQDDIEVLRGPNVYRAFKDIVDYPELYRGVKSVVGRAHESAGIVKKRHQGQSWLDVPLSDSFSQVGGIWVNLMTNAPSADMYIATGAEVSMRSPKIHTPTDGREYGPEAWHVLAQHSRKSDKEFTTDVFVFDAATGQMCEAMLGIQYARVAKESMSKMLTRLTTDKSVLRLGQQLAVAPPTTVKTHENLPVSDIPTTSLSIDASKTSEQKTSVKKNKSSRKRNLTDEVRELVATVSGIDASEFTLDTEMADLGIDSLMGMELAREVDIVFKCTIDQAEQMEATTLRKFVVCVANALERAGGIEKNDDESDETEDSTSSDEGSRATGISTPDETQCPTPAEKYAPSAPATLAKAASAATTNLTLSRSDILESFGEVKLLTDEMMRTYHLDTIHKTEIAGSNRLCVALVVEAMDKLGMPLRTAIQGQLLQRVPFLPQHQRLMECVYQFLVRDARLLNEDIESGQFVRTHVVTPTKSSQGVLDELLVQHPGFAVPNRMTHYAGQSLADVLSGKTDGIRVIFGTPEGRELVQAMYCEHTFNCMNYAQMREVISRLVERVQTYQPGETLKILEMGAGTGGTTLIIAPFLATLDMPVEYTFTDLSPSMVANARRTFGKQYPFMRFAVHDIEKSPADDLKGQHLVLASNAVHATRNLVVSGRNIRETLRPDGFVMILEMTEVVPFVDLVFGLLEGWWLFDDGRKHAVVTAEHWERELHAAGFGHVDWTDGNLPENAFQKVIMALASGPPEPTRLPKSLVSPAETETMKLDRGDVKARELEAETFVSKFTRGWSTPELNALSDQEAPVAPSGGGSSNAVVLVTGATGSLGAHLVQQLVQHPHVGTVVCLNRPSSKAADKRQADAFSSRGIQLLPSSRAKLRVLDSDTSKPNLGLPQQEYNWLVVNCTDIIHNAWPMSGTRAIGAFEPQFQALRNLLDLARSLATRVNNNAGRRIGFQFVSSIGVVGYVGMERAVEERVPMAAVLPGGYPEAKWTCERMLDETLHQYPRLFRPMTVRPGQIAGSSKSGYWNPVEHFAFLVKSAQALRAWPDFNGTLMWLPVDRSAKIIVELLKIGDLEAPDPYPVYHIDNPTGQPWKAMSPVLASALDIPSDMIIPFDAWIARLRRSPLTDTENPASRIADFLEYHFPRMSCGGLILDTQKAQEHSNTMAKEGPVSGEIARRYVAAWNTMCFLVKEI
uniref:Polyketide synthase n=1 Tax=Pestalotiopsis microspora TaxID=85828 RepID=A0A1P8NTH7_PESMI|nr:polyketide synthase [Pestalotiopsis microspora]